MSRRRVSKYKAMFRAGDSRVGQWSDEGFVMAWVLLVIASQAALFDQPAEAARGRSSVWAAR